MKGFAYIATALAVVTLAGCTVHQTEAPALAGPSDLALSLSMTASPDAVSQDGASQSSIKVTARGPNGAPMAALPLRVDMQVGGVPQDFGSLSARTIVTNTDGTAAVVYTAPPSPVGGITGTCNGVPGTCVTILATATGSDFISATPVGTTIRLVPPGVILPPAGTPKAAFTFTPTPVSALVPVMFDGSTSSPGAGANAISSFSWSFGDGTTGTGPTINHTFTTSGTFNVTLTVTNDRGLSASTSQAIGVSSTDPFTGDWVFSPSIPVVGSPVLFNAGQIQTSVGHQVTQFSWDFGDGSTGTGIVASHTYAVAAGYQVVLSVTDDVGRKKVFAAKLLAVTSGAPVANVTFSPAAPTAGSTVNFDTSGSTPSGSATIVSWNWIFGDGTSSTNGPTVQHVFSVKGDYTVRVTLTDSAGRTGTTTVTVTVS
jgi:PKD repeat protein